METMTKEKMKEIYTNKKLRNAVAYAHVCCNKHGKELYKKAMDYPRNYMVTDQQINEAKKEIEEDKKRILADIKNKLIFVGMGMTYETDTEIGNYRIRAEFYNLQGNQFFIEFGGGHGKTRVDHAINRTLEAKLGYDHAKQSAYYNYKGLERLDHYPEYTPGALLNFVNKNFGCSYKELVVDNYTLSTDDFINECN